MKTNSEWNDLIQEHELAYFRGDLALSSPQSYSLAEKAAICDEMEATTIACDKAMHDDFQQLPPELQERLLAMLCDSGVMTPEYWREVLLGEVADFPTTIGGIVNK